MLLWALLHQAPESFPAAEFPIANALVIPPRLHEGHPGTFYGVRQAGLEQKRSTISQPQFTPASCSQWSQAWWLVAGAKPGIPSSWASSEQPANTTDTCDNGYLRSLLRQSNTDCSLLVAETLQTISAAFNASGTQLDRGKTIRSQDTEGQMFPLNLLCMWKPQLFIFTGKPMLTAVPQGDWGAAGLPSTLQPQKEESLGW